MFAFRSQDHIPPPGVKYFPIYRLLHRGEFWARSGQISKQLSFATLLQILLEDPHITCTLIADWKGTLKELRNPLIKTIRDPEVAVTSVADP
jgi:hypothetical protein